MKEEFIVYVWQYGLFDHNGLRTETGEPVKILERGSRNFDSGPDFSNAKIKIGKTLWFGNIEIHKKSSEWKLHKHNLDKAYDNVILHVVLQNDKKIYDRNGNLIPTLKLQNKISSALALKWEQLYRAKTFIPCASQLKKKDLNNWSSWKHEMVNERLQLKMKNFRILLERLKWDWNEGFYILFLKSFGMRVNQDPFELLAHSLPLKYIEQCAANPLSVSALLFGQAGMLNSSNRKKYFQSLRSEYDHLRKKYRLTPIQEQSWKFSRLRPANFPTIRLAQLSAFLQSRKPLLAHFISCNSLKEMELLFDVKTNPFWDHYYTFDRKCDKSVKKIGKNFMHSVLINSIVPYLVFYQQETGIKPGLDPLELFQKIPVEQNKIVKQFGSLNLSAKNAFDSQALLQLHKHHCLKLRCLGCGIGKKVLGSG